jgi:hypothetical protein
MNLGHDHEYLLPPLFPRRMPKQKKKNKEKTAEEFDDMLAEFWTADLTTSNSSARNLISSISSGSSSGTEAGYAAPSPRVLATNKALDPARLRVAILGEAHTGPSIRSSATAAEAERRRGRMNQMMPSLTPVWQVM